MPQIIQRCLIDLEKRDRQGVVHITLPRHAKVLSAGVQRGKPVIWARVDEEQAEEKRRLFLHKCDTQIHDQAVQFIGTISIDNDLLVYHVFSEKLEITIN